MLFLRLCGQFPGIHRWPGAPAKYWELSLPHSHTFVFEALIKTTRDREVEFLDVAKECQTALSHFLEGQPSSSCEALARQLHQILGEMGHDAIACTVLEDGGCGALYTPIDSEDLRLCIL